MKKKIVLLTLAVFLALPGIGTAIPNEFEYMDLVALRIGETRAVLNGQALTMDVGPYAKNGRTLVPFRFLGEVLDADISWIPSRQTAELVTEDLTILMPIGSEPVVNGRAVALDVPAEITGGRLFVPLRFLSEQLGCFVQYDPGTQTILIRKVDQSAWETFTAPNNLSYRVPGTFTIEPDPEEEDVITVSTPNGSLLKTYFSDKSPEMLMSYYQRQGASSGWTQDEIYLTEGQNPGGGYEIRFVKTDSRGEKLVLSIFVDPLAGGSNVGEVTCKEPFNLTDGFLLYQIMNS